MDANPQDAPDTDKLSSCQGCRKRKLKCSKEIPVCSNCQRLDTLCVYDLKKNKPGIRTGVIEGLNRRIEALENAFAARSDTTDGGSRHSNDEDYRPGESAYMANILSVLAQELRKLNSRRSSVAIADSTDSTALSSNNAPSASPASSGSWTRRKDGPCSYFEPTSTQSRKRRRIDSYGNPDVELAIPLEDCQDVSLSLPAPALLEEIVDVYFAAVQPWIPMLHEKRFRERMHNPEELPQLVVVLHAMVVAAAKFVQPDRCLLSPESVETMAKKSRNVVLLNAMDNLSVENLQALVVIAFNDIGNGDASRAWSVVGSLTRTVEYLQLSVEDEGHDKQPLLKPMPSSPPPQSWTEEEERRRVFWVVFILDRFCSITTGWNTSLTADDVRRRLPADGFLWHKEEPVLTPYFGIWDRSVAKIGNSIAFLPTHYPSQKQSHETPSHPDSSASNAILVRSPTSGDMCHVGAFAYCVEATESLSQVTTYFLQQRINWHDRQEVTSWLTRFKELDLRLVHWKMFLPQRWKDSNVSRQPTLINMDPNLTLAHVTHNTSMILLHQRIAYPEADWAQIVQLPSFCSAETCQIAATETANITEKYLKYTESNSPVNSQFAFCVFVSARLLLVHWRHSDSEISPHFWSLVCSLDEMAKRWAGPAQAEHQRLQCLAGRYSERLRDLHRKCVANQSFCIDVLDNSTITSAAKGRARVVSVSENDDTYDEAIPVAAAIPHKDGAVQPSRMPQTWTLQSATLDNQHMSPLPNQAFSFQAERYEGTNCQTAACAPVAGPVTYAPEDVNPMDELSAISHVLLDQRFMDMDRVISFEDNIFNSRAAPSTGARMATDG